MSASTAASSADVRVSTTPSGLGRITLCRERQLNALGAEHVEALRAQLLSWAEEDKEPHCVLLDSITDKALCAGGDVKAARQAVLDQPYADAPPPGHHIHRVFEAEYSTVLLTAAHPSLVACCNGFWMGLGFGIAGYARVRVISDATVFAMPENAIGLWPDVGFAFRAAHMAQHAGLLQGLSGVRITDPADLLHYGIGTSYIPQAQLEAFKADLEDQPSQLTELLQQYSQQPASAGPGPLQRLMSTIEPHMSQLVASWRQEGCDELQALHTLMHQLQEALPLVKASDHGAGELLQHVINGLQYAAPRSLVITLQHFCRVADAVAAARQQPQQPASSGGCRQLPPASWPLGVTVDAATAAAAGTPDLSTLEGTMQMEYRMAVRQVAHEDFIEGVRAALVDKDRRPAWLLDGGAMVQHQLRLSAVGGGDGSGSDAAQGRQPPQTHQLPGNRFSVQHLCSPL